MCSQCSLYAIDYTLFTIHYTLYTIRYTQNIQIMIIKITRYRKTPQTIDGRLTIISSSENSQNASLCLCDTAENALHALRAGKYHISIIKCKQHARKMPVIMLHKDIAPNCEHCEPLECVNHNSNMPVHCSQICPGNGVYNRTDGAIIVGKYIAPGCLMHPKEAFATLYDRIRKSAERGHDLTLIIEDRYTIIRTNELTPYKMGKRALAQMGGRKTVVERASEKSVKHLNS